MKVRVIGSDFAVQSLFVERGWTEQYNDPDLIVFTGGGDVSPGLYGELNVSCYGVNVDRDIKETGQYMQNPGVPKLGICRGAQFLNVMNGGKLHQHVEGHGMGKRKHAFWAKDGNEWPVGPDHPYDQKILMQHEDHHQSMVPPEHGRILARDTRDGTPEIVWFQDTECLCFQAHPEWGHVKTSDMFWQVLAHVFPQFQGV